MSQCVCQPVNRFIHVLDAFVYPGKQTLLAGPFGIVPIGSVDGQGAECRGADLAFNGRTNDKGSDTYRQFTEFDIRLIRRDRVINRRCQPYTATYAFFPGFGNDDFRTNGASR